MLPLAGLSGSVVVVFAVLAISTIASHVLALRFPKNDVMQRFWRWVDYPWIVAAFITIVVGTQKYEADQSANRFQNLARTAEMKGDLFDSLCAQDLEQLTIPTDPATHAFFKNEMLICDHIKPHYMDSFVIYKYEIMKDLFGRYEMASLLEKAESRQFDAESMVVLKQRLASRSFDLQRAQCNYQQSRVTQDIAVGLQAVAKSFCDDVNDMVAARESKQEPIGGLTPWFICLAFLAGLRLGKTAFETRA